MFDERSAIREYDGGVVRAEAERLAFEDVIAHWVARHPRPATSADRCCHCKGAASPDNDVLPMLAVGGHAWVHDCCWSKWTEEHRREAAVALRANGVGATPSE